MPSILRTLSIAANTTNENLISGSSFEFARGPGIMTAGMTADAAGIIANIQAGNDIVAEAFAVPVLANVYPVIPDEMYFTESIEVGDRLVFRAQNTTGAPLVTRTVVQLTFQG